MEVSLQIERLTDLRRRIVETVELREAYVREHKLDTAFCIPDANWKRDGPNDYVQLYTKLRDCPVDDIQQMRPLTRNFSGYTFPAEIEPSDLWVQLWRKHTANIPDRYLFRPISIPGEIGPVFRNVTVNHDTYVYQERINLLLDAGVIAKLEAIDSPVIIEIGGGYGALALALMRILPRAIYVMCDLPESLLFSGMYLGLAGIAVYVQAMQGDRIDLNPGVTLLPNYMFHWLIEQQLPVDLAVNTLSMSEMSEHQVKTYAAGISKLIGKNGVFFEQNQDNRHLGFAYSKQIIPKYFDKVEEVKTSRSGMTQGEAHLWTNAPANREAC